MSYGKKSALPCICGQRRKGVCKPDRDYCQRKQPAFVPDASDIAYEDNCAAACGLNNERE